MQITSSILLQRWYIDQVSDNLCNASQNQVINSPSSSPHKRTRVRLESKSRTRVLQLWTVAVLFCWKGNRMVLMWHWPYVAWSQIVCGIFQYELSDQRKSNPPIFVDGYDIFYLYVFAAVTTCPALEISNGNVSTTATVYGTQAIIDCHEGYMAEQQVVTCNETGQWLPAVDVICKRITHCCAF